MVTVSWRTDHQGGWEKLGGMGTQGGYLGGAKEGRRSPLVRKGRGVGSTRHGQNREGLAVGGGRVPAGSVSNHGQAQAI